MAIQQFNIGACDLISIVTATTTNLNISTLFGDNYSRPQNKTVVIESGVTIGSNSVGSAALVVPSGGAGLIKVINKGSIQGAGGAAGTAGAGGTGGDAVLLQGSAVLINESGAFIYAGGGGGGAGGAGGNGGNGSVQTVLGASGCFQPRFSSCTFYCQQSFGASAYGIGSYQDNTCTFRARCTNCAVDTATTGGAGGAGGNGGRGRGYDGALASGVTGSAGAAGGTNAGTGGTGGTGGSGGGWGASGSTGNTGATGANGTVTNGLAGVAGSSGGLAGFYINGLATYATFTNLGTVAGRTN